MRLLIITDRCINLDLDAVYRIAPILTKFDILDKAYVCDRAHVGAKDFFNLEDTAQVPVVPLSLEYSYENALMHPIEYISPKDVTFLWMCLNPPIDDNLCEAISKMFKHAFKMNDPMMAKEAGSKTFLKKLRPVLEDGYIPDMKVCETPEDLETFSQKHAEFVLKARNSCEGHGIKLVSPKHQYADFRTLDEAQVFLVDNPRSVAMQFLNPKAQSDNRVVVANGEILGCLNRTPMPNGWLCNVGQGGGYSVIEHDEREEEIVKRIDPIMRENGIFLYGMDTLLTKNEERVLSEVNTQNPGGLSHIDAELGVDTHQTKLVELMLSAIKHR